MHQKKRIVSIVAVLLLFVTAGGWYIARGWKPEETAELTGVLETVPTEHPESLDTTEPLTVTVAVPVEKEFLMVFICGEVLCPGVYEIPKDGRLYEVINLAGGFTEAADRTYHNLARQVTDGERIYILSLEETKEMELAERVEGEQAGRMAEGDCSVESSANPMVNLNTAGIEELITLPGIGEAKAESILEYRRKVGRFTDIEEVMNISGIGDAMFERIKDRITVE